MDPVGRVAEAGEEVGLGWRAAMRPGTAHDDRRKRAAGNQAVASLLRQGGLQRDRTAVARHDGLRIQRDVLVDWLTEDNQPGELGRQLANDRRAAGMTLDQLAQASRIDRSTIHRLEQCRVQAPSPQHLKQLAVALGRDVEDYFVFAGYYAPDGLPDLVPYLRAKFDATPELAEQVEQFFRFSQANYERRPDHDKTT